MLVEAVPEDAEGGALTHVVLDSYPPEVEILSCSGSEAHTPPTVINAEFL